MAQINGQPPVLPTPPSAYEAQYMAQLMNVLRAYLTQNAQNISAINTEVDSTRTLLWLDANG